MAKESTQFLKKILFLVKSHSVIFWFSVLVLCCIAYLPSLNNGFMIDDGDFFFNNPKLHYPKYILYELFPLLNPYNSTQPFFYFRPLLHVFPMLFYYFFGLNSFSYHVVNLIVLFLCSVSIFYLIYNLFGDKKLSLLASLLFAFHPFNALIVNMIIACGLGIQIIVMSGSFIYFQRAIKEERTRSSYCISLALFIFSLLFHDLALSFPLLLFSTQLVLSRVNFKRILYLLLPYFLAAAIFYYIKDTNSLVQLTGKISIENQVSFFAQTATTFKLMSWYVIKLFWPKDVVFIWATRTIETNLVLWNIFGFTALLGLIFLLFWNRTPGVIRWSISWLLISIVLIAKASHFEPSNGWIIEPSWLYFISIACFAGIAFGLIQLSKLAPKIIGKIIIFVYVATIFSFTFSLNKIWINQESYCQYWAKHTPGFMIPKSYLASYYQGKGDLDKAEKVLKEAIIDNADQAIIYFKLATIYYAQDKIDLTEENLSKAKEFSPNSSLIRYYLALIDIKQNKIDRAQEKLAEAVAIDPMFVEARFLLARIYQQKGDFIKALKLYQDNLQIDPLHPETFIAVRDITNQIKPAF